MSQPTIDYSGTKVMKGLLRAGLRRMNKFVPRSFDVSPPIVQLFVHEPPRLRTHYTFVNFTSLYSPGTSEPVRYVLTLRDDRGHTVGKAKIEVPPFGSVDCDPERVFGCKLPALGSLCAQIRSRRLFSYSDKHLGKVTAHFYALYRDEGMRALSVIHPQTAIWNHTPRPERWSSNMLIPPATLESIRFLQVNPTQRPVQTEIVLRARHTGEIVERSVAAMAPMGARSVTWQTDQLSSRDMLYLTSDSLTAPNAKPLVFLFFRNGAFSAAHS